MNENGKKLNILFIVTDQERADIPSAIPLHAHDRLKARGTSFSNFHVTTTPCGPSRSVIYSGLHTNRTRMVSNPNTPPRRTMPTEIETLGGMFRKLGYETAYKGKWHLSHVNDERDEENRVFPVTTDALEPYGFADYNYDGDPHGRTWTGYRQDRMIAADAAQWIDGRKHSGTPWFLAVNFVNPHDIMFFTTGEHQTATRYSPNMVSPLGGAPHDPEYRIDWKLPLPKSFHDDLATKPWSHREDVVHCNAFYGEMPHEDEEVWHIYRNYYFNCLRDVDRQLGLLLDALEESGEAENTVIVFTADHGEMAAAHGLRGKGPTYYREVACVPLIVVHPDGPRAVETEALGTSLDLAPTLLSMAGMSGEERAGRFPALKGCDLSPAILQRDGRSERDERGTLYYYGTTLYWDPELIRGFIGLDSGRPMPAAVKERIDSGNFPCRENRALIRGLFDGRYRFARYFAPADHHRPEDWETLAARNDLELYDTASDRDEIANLAGDLAHRETLLRLNTQLNAAMDAEVGADDGREYDGGPELYRQNA